MTKKKIHFFFINFFSFILIAPDGGRDSKTLFLDQKRGENPFSSACSDLDIDSESLTMCHYHKGAILLPVPPVSLIHS